MSWSPEQLANAQTIVNVGKRLGASNRDIQIALMTGLVESGLRNLSYGDRDSVGVFQQRAAWGSYNQRTDVAESARMFFQGGHAGQRGLFDFKNRDQMSMGQAAQAVQVSAFPDRYAQQQGSAAGILKQLGVPTSSKGTLGEVAPLTPVVSTTTTPETMSSADITQVGTAGVTAAGTPGMVPTVGASGMKADPTSYGVADQGGVLGAETFGSNPMAQYQLPTLEQLGVHLGSTDTTTTSATGGVPAMPTDAAEGWRKAVVRMAHQALGTPYVWGGTSLTSGVDCSGLVQSIYNQLGFKLPRVSADQARSGQQIGFDQLKPGDLVAINNSTRNNGADHIGIFIGNGHVIEAPHPGGQVEVGNLSEFDGGWGVRVSK